MVGTPFTGLLETTSFSTMTYSSVSSEPTRAIIVGAGVAGLGCAIECERKGHDVVVLEKVGTFKVLGETR